MKKVGYSLLVAAALASSSAFAADMPTKAPPAPPPPPSPWDVVVTAALMNDYNFRGITQSDHKPSTQAGFEVRYNWSSSLQTYAGVSGESIDFPNDAAAEIDLYGGIRPTFDKLALDFGFWDYYYPGGQCYGFAGVGPSGCGDKGGGPIVFPAGSFVPNSNFQPLGGNEVLKNESFWEVYAKATYTINDQWAVGVQEWYSPSVVNTGAWGWFSTGNVTFTEPSSWYAGLSGPLSGLGGYISADLGYWDLGTSNVFYGTGVPGSPFEFGVKYTSYATWDAGFGFTWKVLTLDLRYYDTNLNKQECSVFTSAQNATFVGATTQDPNGLGTNWCGAAFVAKLSASIDFNSNLK
jgi:Bacterial protein of unknown function (Gcw_chp)